MVARRMALLSLSFIESFPYKYNLSSSDRCVRLFLIKIGITLVAMLVWLHRTDIKLESVSCPQRLFCKDMSPRGYHQNCDVFATHQGT